MVTKLIIGIGNPDEEYKETRHNIGLMFLDAFARELKANDFENKGDAATTKATGEIAGKRTAIVLAKPNSHVNVTGPVVAKLKTTTKTKPEDIILVQDDLDIPFGKVKLSFDRDSAGHRGVESVMKSLKTKKFYRLRLGTANSALAKAYRQGGAAKDEFIKKFVLAKFTPSEREELKKIFKHASEILSHKGHWQQQ